MWNLHQNNNQHKTHDFMDKYWAKLCELEEKYTPASFKQVDRGEVLLLSSDQHHDDPQPLWLSLSLNLLLKYD